MTNIDILCAWVGKRGECEALATYTLIMHGGNAGYDGKHLESCDRHLPYMARGMKDLYAIDTVTIEEVKQ